MGDSSQSKPSELVDAPELSSEKVKPGMRPRFFSQKMEQNEPEKQAEPQKTVESQSPKDTEPDAPKMADAHAYLQRPYTPEQAMSKPEYDGSGWGEPDDELDDEPGTPESVIHHRMPEDQLDEEEFVEVEKELPAVPEREATIKASGSKLKTRASNTPADLAAMREARRHVSYEVPDVPPIPARHRNRLSRDMGAEQDAAEPDEFLERHPSFKKRSLTLDLDLGLSLDQDFERVIEAQKVSVFFHILSGPLQAQSLGGLFTKQVSVCGPSHLIM